MATSTDALTPRTVTHPRLSTETTWTALGDLSLLDADSFVPVILSRSLMPAKLDAEIKRITDAVRAGAVAVGGFISFGEKRAARKLAAVPNLRLIRILPYSLVDYPLTDTVRERLLKGATLILSGIPGNVTTLSRANCVRTNTWITQLCEARKAPTATVAPTPPVSPAPHLPQACVPPAQQVPANTSQSQSPERKASPTPAPQAPPCPSTSKANLPQACIPPKPEDDPAAIFL